MLSIIRWGETFFERIPLELRFLTEYEKRLARIACLVGHPAALPCPVETWGREKRVCSRVSSPRT